MLCVSGSSTLWDWCGADHIPPVLLCTDQAPQVYEKLILLENPNLVGMEESSLHCKSILKILIAVKRIFLLLFYLCKEKKEKKKKKA